MNVIIIRWLYLEILKLTDTYNKEIRKFFLKFDLMEYLKVLFFGKSKKLLIIVIRILFLFFLFKFFWDIFKVIFFFYYITMNWVFSNLKFFIKFYTSNDLVISFFYKFFDFIKYFILLIPIVRLNEKLKKRKIKLYVYMLEKIVDYMIRLIRWRPRIRRSLSHLIPILQFLVIYFGWVPWEFFKGGALIFLDYLELFLDKIALFNVYIKILLHVKQYNKSAGNLHLRQGASLFHIAIMLQRQGLTVPPCKTFDRLKANIEYKEYCRKYKKSELTPDFLDDKAIDIYVVLLDLFSETRYELKRLPIIEFFLLLYPYKFFVNLFSFLLYFYIGLIYFLCFIFFPLLFIYLGIGVTYEYLKSLEIIYYLFFHNLDHLAKEKNKVWAKIRKDTIKNEKNEKKKQEYEKKKQEYEKKKEKIKLLLKKIFTKFKK